MSEHSRFAVCIKNIGYTASLELRKLYEVVNDPDAELDDMIRIIDESGEDYLYSADRFVFAHRYQPLWSKQFLKPRRPSAALDYNSPLEGHEGD